MVTYNKRPSPPSNPNKRQWVWHLQMQVAFTTQVNLLERSWPLSCRNQWVENSIGQQMGERTRKCVIKRSRDA
jgi:hypothetical protein